MRTQWKAVALATAVALGSASMLAQAAGSAGADPRIEAILDAWQAVPAAQGGDVAAWRDVMRIQLKLASPAALEKLQAMTAPADAQRAEQQFVGFTRILGADVDARLQAQKQAVREKAAKDGVEAKSLGSFGIDQTFIPITPCRVVDTRNVGGAYGNFATRNFYFYTTSGSLNWFTQQGGVFGAASSTCPQTVFTNLPSAAVATITVTGQGGPGNLIAWGGADPVASASTLSYAASGDTSSLATIPWGGRGGTGAGGPVLDFAIKVNAGTTANVVVDIVGYYTQPQATALDCTIVQTATTTIPVNAWTNVDATCPVGYVATGGGNFPTEGTLGQPGLWMGSVPVSDRTWRIWVDNQTGGARTIQTWAQCCRVPGR